MAAMAIRTKYMGTIPARTNPLPHVTLTGGAITLVAVRWGAWVIAAAYVLWGPPLPVYTRHEPELLIWAFAQTLGLTLYPILIRPRLTSLLPQKRSESLDLLGLGLVDLALAMYIFYLSGGWGSPFYHFTVTALVVPAFLIGPRGCVALIIGFIALYLTVLSTSGAGTAGDWTGVAWTHLLGHLITAVMVVGAVQLLAHLTRELAAERDEKQQIAAQEERTRIAREIHDGVAQSIYMLSLNLESALELANGRLRDRLAKLSLLTRECLLEVRQYIFDLRPLLTGEAELADALRGQIKEFQTITGLPVRLDLVGEARSLSLGVAITAYRVAQEALANAFRHAHASQIVVTLRYTDSGLEMLIDDDGCGIPAGIEGDGHGLRNMRERVTSHGGSIHLEGRPQEGTRVRIALPFA